MKKNKVKKLKLFKKIKLRVINTIIKFHDINCFIDEYKNKLGPGLCEKSHECFGIRICFKGNCKGESNCDSQDSKSIFSKTIIIVIICFFIGISIILLIF